MDRETLYQEWTENKDRAAWVRNRREAIHEHTDTSEPIPTGSLHDVRQWLESYKGTVTRQLNDDTEGTDPDDSEDSGETDTTADAEQGV